MNKRILGLGIVFTLFTLILLSILWRIQVIDVESTQKFSDSVVRQRIIQIPLESERGNILDKYGIPLTGGSYKDYMFVFTSMVPDQDSIVQFISVCLDIKEDEIQKKLASSPTYAVFPAENIPKAEKEKIQNGEIPGITLVEIPIRYDEDSLARHVIGYMNTASETGADGIEKVLNDVLCSNRKRVIYGMVDAKQNLIPGIGYHILESKDEEPQNVLLTLDSHIQRIVEKELDKKNYKGAVVVTEAETGNILAMASRPNFDQNNLVTSMKQQDHPFVNRPLQAYMPGSVFKTVVLAAFLESEEGDEEQIFECTGGIWLGNHFVNCHSSRKGLGEISLEQAFAYSCNDTFIRIAQKMGGESIIEMAHLFGFGSIVDIGLTGESPGQLPEASVYAGSGIGNLAIGQGDVQVTPLQVADMMTTIVNSGQRKKLKLIEGIKDTQGNWIQRTDSQLLGRVIRKDTADKIKNFLDKVTQYGTGINANDASFGGCGGKTGTPEISVNGNSQQNGWFAGYFPKDDPRYIIVVFIEDAAQGSAECTPVFRNIAEGIHEYESKITILE